MSGFVRTQIKGPVKKQLVSAFSVGVFIALGSTSLFAESDTSSSDTLAQEITTEAGHDFWYYPMPKANRTALAITWEQEVPVDEATHPATAEIAIELMLNGGAGGRDAAEIVADYQDLDAGSGLWVQPKHASGFIVAPDKHLSTAREIAGQVLTAPALEQRWFDREHQNYVEGAIEGQSGIWGSAWSLTRNILLGEHPYNNFWKVSPVEKVKSVSLADVKKWHRESFNTNTATIAVAGSAPAETVAKEIDLLFADLPANTQNKPVAFNRPQVPGKTILLHKPDAPKSAVLLVGSLPDDDQSTVLALQLGVGVLGHGKQSRLFKTVRSGMGATYGFGAGIFNFTRDYRMLEMSGEIETAKLQPALEEIEKAYTELRVSGIGRIEFPIAKGIFKREAAKQFESPVNVAFTLSEAVLKGYSADYVQNLTDNIGGLKRDTTNAVINSALPAYESILKVIVSPDDKAVPGACVITKIEDASECL